MSQSTEWNVFLNGKWIDTVYFVASADEHYVLNSLVDHDGYDPKITVKSITNAS